MTSTATTGPAITPGLMPPFDEEDGLGLHWIVGHCEHVLLRRRRQQMVVMDGDSP